MSLRRIHGRNTLTRGNIHDNQEDENIINVNDLPTPEDGDRLEFVEDDVIVDDETTLNPENLESAMNVPPPPQDLAEPSNSLRWDFREGILPTGVEVIGSEPQFQLQKDGSTALYLPPMSYLKVSFESFPYQMRAGFGGKLINDYSITMDLYLDRLPADSMSLFQCSGNQQKTEGEAFVYPTGGVGIFGEIGSPDASFRPNQWNRVVVTMGPEQIPKQKRANREFKYDGHDGDEQKIGYDGISSDLYRSKNRILTTYVNSKKCTAISSANRGVLATVDGRFAVSTEGITIFGSNNFESMNSGKLIKFLEFRRGALTENAVRRDGYNNRYFSNWDKERKTEILALQSQLRLKPIYKNPPPIWMHPVLCALFGDSFLEGTGLEGGSLSASASVFDVVIDHLSKSLVPSDEMTNNFSEASIQSIFSEFDFSHDDRQALNYIHQTVNILKILSKKYDLAKQNGAPQMVFYFKLLKKYISSLQVGETLLLPGGIGESVIIYVLEREAENNYRFSVINTNPYAGLDWHQCDPASSPPLIKYQTLLSVKDVRQEKIFDDMFWGILLKLAILPAKENQPDKLYDLLLPYLVDKPIDQIVYESESDKFFEYRFPQKSDTAYVRTMLEAVHYLLKRHGISDAKSTQLLFSIESQFLEFIQHDLSFIRKIGNSERKIVELCCDEYSRNSARLGSQNLLNSSQLSIILGYVRELKSALDSIPCNEGDAVVHQPSMQFAPSELTSLEQDSLSIFPLFDRLRRTEDVNGLAGPPIVLPQYVPIDMLQIPVVVNTLGDALEAIRYCDRLCTLISVQQHCVKNRSYLKLSLIEHTFVKILPCPKPKSSLVPCIWQTPMSYSLQLDICICLGRILEHFISAAFSLHNNKPLDAIKLIITGSIAAMVDVTIRHVSTDQTSEFCLHYIGQRGGGLGNGFGISMASFDTQSETIELHTPDLCVARQAILDYFYDQKSLKKIFNWEGGHQLDEPTAEFLSNIANSLAFPADAKSLISYVTTRNQLINKNYPEFHILRDIAFYVKYVQNVDPRAFPPLQEYSQMAVELNWSYDQGMFMIEAFARNFFLRCYPDPPFVGNKSRYPSAALPSHLAPPHNIKTEDDVLHIKNLPSFNDCLGQQDSELLLSYLTVPYLRIPLILTLFTTEDRIHALRSEELQSTLDSVIFEPDKFLYSDISGEPSEVPAKSREHLSTIYGLLWNEIQKSPDVFLESIIKLLTLSLDLDVGTFHSQTVSIILYVTRLASRIESFITYLLNTELTNHLRSLVMEPSVFNCLRTGITKIQNILRGKLHNMLESWCSELSQECESLENNNDIIVDENTRSACKVHAHILFLYRNLPYSEYNLDFATRLSSSFMFLTTRHTWNLNLLGLPEHEIYEVLSMQRRNLILWVRSQPQLLLNEIMESTIRVTAGTGSRKNSLAIFESNNQWAYLEGSRSIGRFSVASTRRSGTDEYEHNLPIPTLSASVELGIEIDFQTSQLTLKSSHLKALDTKVANDYDVQTVFGKKSMQGSITESTIHRTCINLIGRGHTIHHWQTPDERSCIQLFDREYSPGELHHSEEWIIPIFEPVRLAYMTRPFVLQICLPSEYLSPDADVACLIGIHPKNGGTWKEIYVFKSLQMVHVYNVLSHGRRFYRVLEYTSNCKYTLRELQPSLEDRMSPWPEWERYGAGHPYFDHWNNPITCVISRSWDYEQNLSGGEETYIPSRLLYGILPQSLLDNYMFWQDEKDNLRGYANDKSSPYFIFVELIDVTHSALLTSGTGAKIHRILRRPIENRMKKQMDLLRYLDNSHLVNDESWKVDFSLLETLGKIIDSGCDINEVKEFIEALKASGVTFPEISGVLVEIENFAIEQGNTDMEIAVEIQNLSLETEDLTLLNWLYSPSNSKYSSTMKCLTRVENISNSLMWTMGSTMSNPSIDFLEMPRLKLNFHEKCDDRNVSRLFSMDHSHLFVSNFQSKLTSKLMFGLPHSLLMSTVNNEQHILVPVLDLVRPKIAIAPFTTELVFNRNSPDWHSALDTQYYIYPIHVSLSFLFSPTLSSALYLLFTRFLSRNYEDVFRLANTIGTDAEFSSEEALIFESLGRLNSDCHPDAHASRLKISYLTLDAPVTCPWDLTRQCSRYISKLSHISLVCRLTLEEEYQLLHECVCDSNDPRFYNAKGQPKYSVYEVTLVKNRKSYLEAMFKKGTHSTVFAVPHLHGSRWPVTRNLVCLMMDADSFSTLEVNYAAPAQLSGHAVIEVVNTFWSGQEDSTGRYGNMGFLFIYELFTGSKTAKILSQDISHSLAIFLYELLVDKHEEALLPSILSLMCRLPYLRELLPKYQDTRTFRNRVVKAYCDDRDPISPLGTLLHEILEVLQTQISNIMADYELWSNVPLVPGMVCSVPSQSSLNWVIPLITDFSLPKRVLTELTEDRCATFKLDPSLCILLDELKNFAEKPLSPLQLGKYTLDVTRYDCGLGAIDSQIPFDVSTHPQAKTAVAQSMISRLGKDVHDYATMQNSAFIPRCSFLRDAYLMLNTLSSDEVKQESLKSRHSLQCLIDELISLRESDERYVQTALEWLSRAANDTTFVPTTRSQLLYLLNRECRFEATIWAEFLFASMLSTKQSDDLRRLNPFLTLEHVDILADVISAAVLHANRISHINRCIKDCRELESALNKIESLRSVPGLAVPKKVAELSASLSISDESLSRNLTMERHYIERCQHVGGEEKRQRIEMSFDPRFLLFEFTWSILLRKSQVEIVEEYIQNISMGTSTVKQMIMGAGKTTVVCPLLTLMLGDGENLIVQVVPPALLELSRAVMRSTFSSIMHKRIFTLSFDRSSEVDQTIFKKLIHSIQTRGVVITTPATVKSMFLKFLEWMCILNDPNSPKSPKMELDCQELGKILKLFRDAVLIMDEVDLILHPMKSELNFPIGERSELDYSPQRWQMPIHILDAVFYVESFRLTVGFKQSSRAKAILESLRETITEGYRIRALQRNPHVVLLNIEWYHAVLKPIIADWLYMWIETQHLGNLSESIVKQYILQDGRDGYNADLGHIIESSVSMEHRKMLNLARDWLKSYLPHILQKVDRVSFGLLNKEDYERAIAADPHMPRTRGKLAIPFVGKDVPSRSSEFAHPDVIIGLTILAYRYEGLRWSDFEDIISNIRSTLTKEIGPYRLRKSSILYSNWVRDAGGSIKGESDPTLQSNPEKEVIPLRLLKRSNEEQMKKLFGFLSNHPDTIHFYLENFIFPAYMDSKILKLSAAGQELGGEMIFKRRIGFSGTPSDLLPVELGRCGYEKGSDGQMIHVMTSPSVCSYEIISLDWTPQSILLRICNAPDDSKFHALIDTGALITGMSNFEVAQFLLNNGLAWCEGVVFLDSYDRKMVLVRSTRRVLKMAQCGIPPEKRFAFYDQVHTTGMDIQHALNACAILTLSKDMVFRDYAQGAYRMRGINKGQTIHLLLIPEVCDLISRELMKVGKHSKITSFVPTLGDSDYFNSRNVNLSDHAIQDILIDINAWLVINSMRSERVQFHQLCLQNISNIWRKSAYATLLKSYTKFSVESVLPSNSDESKALELFCEPIDFSLEVTTPTVTPFIENIKNKVRSHSEFVLDQCQHPVVKEILGLLDSSQSSLVDESEEDRSRLLHSEMIQEREQEKEQQTEVEAEQEIEIEKYVDLAYSRENDEQIPWNFESLATEVFTKEIDGSLKPVGHPTQFYAASEFKLVKRNPLNFPHHMLISNNYFDPRWSGARRIKNVVMILDWIPKQENLQEVPMNLHPLTEAQDRNLRTALLLFGLRGKSCLNFSEFSQILKSAGQMESTFIDCAFSLCHPSLLDDELCVSVDAAYSLLVSGNLSPISDGRRLVAISLAEAETLRRILHIRNERACVNNQNVWTINGFDIMLSLRCVPGGNIVIDQSCNALPSLQQSSYTTVSAFEAFRYFNCDMYFNENSLNALLRSLHHTSKRERRQFFKNILMCRRRLNKKWMTSPISKLFVLSDQFGMLKQRALAVALRNRIQLKGLLLYDAFCKFNYSGNGYLTPGEVWGGFEFLGIDCSPHDILDFFNAADIDKDGLLNFRDFLESLQEQDSLEQAQIGLEESVYSPSDGGNEDLIMPDPMPIQRQVSLTPVSPKGQDELENLRLQQKQAEELEDLEASRMEDETEQRIKDELEAEEDERDRLQEGGRNPLITDDQISYNFTTGRMPRKMKVKGDIGYVTDDFGTHLMIHPASGILLSIPYRSNCGGRRLNQYTINLEIKFHLIQNQDTSSFPASLPDDFDEDGLTPAPRTEVETSSYAFPIISYLTPFQTSTKSKSQLWIDTHGGLHTFDGLCSVSSISFNKIQRDKWHVLTVVVDCVEHEMEVYLDGKSVHSTGSADSGTIKGLTPPGMDIDSHYSLGGELSLFGDLQTPSSASSSQGRNNAQWAIRHFSLYPRCLHQTEVPELVNQLKRESDNNVVTMISLHLQSMGVDPQIAHWAAVNSEGTTIEQRINSALNQVYS